MGDSLLPLRPLQTTLQVNGIAVPVDGLNLRGAFQIPGPAFWERPKLLRSSRLMARYAKWLDPMFPERAADLDYRSMRDHVCLYFGPGNLEFWLAPEIQATHGDSVEELSRVAMLLKMQALGIGERRPASPGLPRRPLLELAQAAAERLNILRDTVVMRIDEEPSGGFRVEAITGAGDQMNSSFDAVVVALGAEQAGSVCLRLLAPAERDFFRALQQRPVVTLSVALEGVDSGLPSEVRFPRRSGSAISSLVTEPGQTGGRVPEGRSQIVALARDAFAERWSEMSDDVVSKNLMGSLESAMPGIRDRLLTSRLGRGQVPFFSVGSYRRLAVFQKVQRDRRALGRRLYWAGDYLSGPGFESASLSGLRAANALVRDFE
jgi:predicted NAD/FAD-dependent oxidoreductase